MIYRLILGTMVFAIILVSCNKDHGNPNPDTPPSEEPTPKILLKDIVLPHLPSPYYHFEYNADSLVTKADFASSVDFVDLTTIPPNSTIGLHEHHGNEEIYFIAAGRPRVTVDGEERRLERGSIAVVHSGQTHRLINDTGENVEIFVIQVRH